MPLLHYQKLVNSLFVICSRNAGIPSAYWTFNTRIPVGSTISSEYILWGQSGSGMTRTHAESDSTGRIQVVSPNSDYRAFYSWDASRINSIYGNSKTVTPLSETCKFFIKY